MSAEALRAAIEEERRRAEAEKARLQELQAETEQAKERQRLREELKDMILRRRDAEERNAEELELREGIDDDEIYPPRSPCVMQASDGETVNFRDKICTGEHLWRIEGFSWVPCALEQCRAAYGSGAHFVHSHFELGRQTFLFCYSPWADRLCYQHHGSLAIVLHTVECIALRYRIHVKAQSGEFVQWGDTSNVIHNGRSGRTCAYGRAYGPDVHWPGDPPASLGIFGLSHEELLESQWVQNDTLTLKFELEVRPDEYETRQGLSLAAEVPEPTIIEDTRALLEQGTCSDVRFMVQDEVIQAHSQVLCARSEVFRKQLTGGMQESVSKVVVIEDCDAATFKAFLQFLYTDQLPDVQELLPKETSSGNEAGGFPPLSSIQALLAVSHKYQVMRLQLWCEATLSKQVNAAQVCGILSQANLLQAKQLEKACLSFIKDHAAQVLTLPAMSSW